MSPRPITENILFYGDNLIILRAYIPSDSVNLIYLVSPFNVGQHDHMLWRNDES